LSILHECDAAMFCILGDAMFSILIDDAMFSILSDDAMFSILGDAAMFSILSDDAMFSILGDDAMNVQWMDLCGSLDLYASHVDFLSEVAKSHSASW
jgi:hypothetical protein